MAGLAAVEASVSAHAPEGRDNAKLRQILEGARKVFLAEGFDGASMNDVARAAGVSKGTLYVYFDSKEALFEALVRSEKQLQAERVYPFEMSNDDLDATLRAIGRGLLQMLTRPDNVAIVRMVIGVSGKFPAIGRAFHEADPQFGQQRLAAYLDRQVAAGRVKIADTKLAASNFLQLSHSEIVKAQLFCVIEQISEAEIERSIENAVDIFMRIYGVDQQNQRA